jgi:hypothetical protein
MRKFDTLQLGHGCTSQKSQKLKQLSFAAKTTPQCNTLNICIHYYVNSNQNQSTKKERMNECGHNT